MEGVNIIYNYIDDFILYHRASFLRATNFADFVDFLDFHEICFTENYWKSYHDMDCRLKRRQIHKICTLKFYFY